MLVCRIELWSGGNPFDVDCIATLGIANDETGTERIGNYDYVLVVGGAKFRGRIERWNRDDGALSLVQTILAKEEYTASKKTS